MQSTSYQRERDKTRSPPAAPCTIIAPMHWIAPFEKDTDNAALEKRLWCDCNFPSA